MTEPEWRASVDRRLGHIESEIGSMKTKDAVADVHRTNVETRLTSIEGTLTWLVRLIIGALILALVGFALGGGLK